MRSGGRVTAGLLTLIMLALAAWGMSLVLLKTRPLTAERIAAPDLQ
jgi:hypothetical protein